MSANELGLAHNVFRQGYQTYWRWLLAVSQSTYMESPC
jgi:hypothetical protein